MTTPLNYVTSPHLTNQLDEFTSYSYHFVMSVTDTTTAIGKMLDQSNASISSSGQNSYLSNVLACKRPGEQIPLGDDDKAWLLIDTRRFSEYQITALDMEHVYGAGTAENPSVPSNTMNVQVVDTTGMSFFDMLMTLFREEIKSARLSCFFMISVVFVGHRPDGSTENTIIATCHIPAILLLMQFAVDHRGSTYDMVFMENDGGVASGSNMEAINSMGNVTAINSQIPGDPVIGEPTLGNLIQALEDKLNTASIEFYKNYRNEAIAKGAAASDITGKLVQYMITVPDEWRGFICKQATKARNIPQLYVIEGVDIGEDSTDAERAEFVNKVRIQESYNTPVSISFAPNTTITQAVSHILMSCKDVLDLASAEKREAGEATLFKTVMNVTSDKSTYVVHIDVIPHKYPKAESLAVTTLQSSQPSTGLSPNSSTRIAQGEDTPKNLIVYDYIFTGNNSHITNLNIKYMPESVIALDSGIDIGKNRFQSMSAVGAGSQTNMQAAANPERNTSTYAPTIRPNDPIIPGVKTVQQKTNNASADTESAPSEEAKEQGRALNEFTISTAYLHFISSMELTMTIRGNPSILRKHADRQTKGGQPPHPSVIDATQLRAINNATGQTAEQIFTSIVQRPLRSAKDLYYNSYVKPKIESATSTAQAVAQNGPDLMASPLFFKVNIKAPNIDFRTGQTTVGDDQPAYTSEFFFDGPYLSTSVKTHFESGNFTHDIQLIPYILNGQDPFSNSGSR